MNCKPGDLAVFVAMRDNEVHRRNAGRLFHVLYRAADLRGMPSWVAMPVRSAFDGVAEVTHEGEILDKYLRPIRPQSDDAKDETLEWLPVPSRELVNIVKERL